MTGQIILSTTEITAEAVVLDFCEQVAKLLYGKKFADTRQVRPIPVVVSNFENINREKKHYILFPDELTMQEYLEVDCIIYLDRMLKFARLYLGVNITYMLYNYVDGSESEVAEEEAEEVAKEEAVEAAELENAEVELEEAELENVAVSEAAELENVITHVDSPVSETAPVVETADLIDNSDVEFGELENNENDLDTLLMSKLK